VSLPVDDRVALRELVEAYGMAVDSLDADWFGSLWTPDAVLAVHDATGETRRWEGDKIAGMVAGVGRYLRTLHFVGNHHARAEGPVVSGTTYCFAHHLVPDPDGSEDRARDRVLAIRYDDVYARGAPDSSWRFARRDVRMLWRAHHDVELLGHRA
jgi:hypothetical protein